jgi:hypothetical protein
MKTYIVTTIVEVMQTFTVRAKHEVDAQEFALNRAIAQQQSLSSSRANLSFGDTFEHTIKLAAAKGGAAVRPPTEDPKPVAWRYTLKDGSSISENYVPGIRAEPLFDRATLDAAIAQARLDERERCAKVCEQTSWGAHRGDYLRGHEDARRGVAAAIRALKEWQEGA